MPEDRGTVRPGRVRVTSAPPSPDVRLLVAWRRSEPRRTFQARRPFPRCSGGVSTRASPCDRRRRGSPTSHIWPKRWTGTIAFVRPRSRSLARRPLPCRPRVANTAVRRPAGRRGRGENASSGRHTRPRPRRGRAGPDGGAPVTPTAWGGCAASAAVTPPRCSRRGDGTCRREASISAFTDGGRTEYVPPAPDTIGSRGVKRRASPASVAGNNAERTSPRAGTRAPSDAAGGRNERCDAERRGARCVGSDSSLPRRVRTRPRGTSASNTKPSSSRSGALQHSH